MKVVLDIEDQKADFVMELLSNFPFVQAQPVMSKETQKILAGLKEAIEEVKLAKEGKIKLTSAKDFLDEL